MRTTPLEKCDQRASLLVQYLAIHNNEYLPNNISKICQIKIKFLPNAKLIFSKCV